MSSKHNKTVADWANDVPTVVRKEQVEAILREYFGEGFKESQSGGSHLFRVKHKALIGHPHMEMGTLSIPVSNGQVVKREYIKRILKAIEQLPEKDSANEKSE
jgi:predicted RNA binding protein YcfA (HicA-like mRNA interferase family)